MEEGDSDGEPLEAPISKVDPHPDIITPKPVEAPVELPIPKQQRSNPEKSEIRSQPKRAKGLPAGKEVEPPKFKLVHKPRRNPTLLENLLSSEISRERSEILQCVKYVCEKNFFGIGKK